MIRYLLIFLTIFSLNANAYMFTFAVANKPPDFRNVKSGSSSTAIYFTVEIEIIEQPTSGGVWIYLEKSNSTWTYEDFKAIMCASDPNLEICEER